MFGMFYEESRSIRKFTKRKTKRTELKLIFFENSKTLVFFFFFKFRINLKGKVPT